MKTIFKILCSISAPAFLLAAEPANLPQDFEGARIIEKLGNKVDIQNLRFTDEDGKVLPLSTYFTGKKPVVMILAYYSCPGLCGYLLNGAANSLRTLNWSIGSEYEVITLSINPKEGPDLAAKKKLAYLEKYGRLGAEKGWHFLTGKEDQIVKVAGQLGFGYRYDEKTSEYAHSAGIFVLTPEGKISRVLYGIDFPNKDLKLSLLEASDGKVGTILDRILMFCYRYDPLSKGYSFVAMRLVQGASAVLVLFMAVFLFFLFRNERKLSA
ncbi:MAG: SCO1/SenC family protein [Bacteriovoracaceae bacterium]|nr:SCO1/SenC family protein [Bacteriovoracaceae bacterium]